MLWTQATPNNKTMKKFLSWIKGFIPMLAYNFNAKTSYTRPSDIYLNVKAESSSDEASELNRKELPCQKTEPLTPKAQLQGAVLDAMCNLFWAGVPWEGGNYLL